MARLATRSGDRVLATGATGRIGANLCRALLARDYRLRAIVMPEDPARARLDGLDVDIVGADLREEAAVVEACRDVQAICQLAAGGMLTMAPVIVFALLVRRYFLAGITSGGVSE